MTQPALLVLAAGMGSRYGGLKQVDPVGPSGEAIIDYSIRDALRAGFGKLVFVIRAGFADTFRRQIGDRYAPHADVSCVHQTLDALPAGRRVPAGRTKPWGTAHAVWCAADQIDEPFAVINADDFYGRAAYATAARFLQQAQPDGRDYAMVGYRLAHTLSAFGGVSRGICSCDRAGHLQRVTETHGIRRQGDRIVADDPDQPDNPIELTGNETVSMNLWAFTPTIFDELAAGFGAFLDRHGDDPTSECYIPACVDALVAADRARVRVLACDAKWFGLTFPQDKRHVQASIAQRVEAGEYPPSLRDAPGGDDVA